MIGAILAGKTEKVRFGNLSVSGALSWLFRDFQVIFKSATRGPGVASVCPI